MEIWDIYDDNHMFTGRTIERGQKLAEGDYHIVVNVWVVNQNGEILITKRHPSKPYALLWECTGGSAVSGENSLEAAVREVKEEIGLDVAVCELDMLSGEKRQFSFADTFVTVQNFSLEKLTLQATEVIDAKLVSLDEVLKLHDEKQLVCAVDPRLYAEKLRQYTIK